MDTYTTMDGRIFDLSALTAEERDFLQQAVTLYREGVPAGRLFDLRAKKDSPLLAPTAGWVTRAVFEHPVYQALFDLEGRLAVQQGTALEPGESVDHDPLDDVALPVAAAAAEKGVTLDGLYRAVRRGEVLGRRVGPGAGQIMVSRNSLARWQPDRARQAAGRRRAAVAAGRRAAS